MASKKTVFLIINGWIRNFILNMFHVKNQLFETKAKVKLTVYMLFPVTYVLVEHYIYFYLGASPCAFIL